MSFSASLQCLQRSGSFARISGRWGRGSGVLGVHRERDRTSRMPAASPVANLLQAVQGVRHGADDDRSAAGSSVEKPLASGVPGALTSKDAWDLMVGTSNAVLVDVRTRAEWSFVGVPDISKLGNRLVFLEWQSFPTMAPNLSFVEDLGAELDGKTECPILFLCRSGARSMAAAYAMSEVGFTHCLNVSDGFEGDLGPDRKRGALNGWKASGLPWVQS